MKNIKKIKFGIVLSLVFALASCSQKSHTQSQEEQLKTYINHLVDSVRNVDSSDNISNRANDLKTIDSIEKKMDSIRAIYSKK